MRRDAAILGTGSSPTFALIALIYFNGNHYITVGRSCEGLHLSDVWVLWDAMDNAGVGRELQSPPTGSGPLRTRTGSKVWEGYLPTVAIYLRMR